MINNRLLFSITLTLVGALLIALMALSIHKANAQSVGIAAWGSVATPPITISGPSSGNNGSASTNFTITLTNGSFNGAQTVSIGDNLQGGTFTPSVGSPGTSSVTVTPAAAATSFTFTYTPVVIGVLTLTVTNGQAWPNPMPVTYTSISICTTGQFDFSNICQAVAYLTTLN